MMFAQGSENDDQDDADSEGPVLFTPSRDDACLVLEGHKGTYIEIILYYLLPISNGDVHCHFVFVSVLFQSRHGHLY